MTRSLRNRRPPSRELAYIAVADAGYGPRDWVWPLRFRCTRVSIAGQIRPSSPCGCASRVLCAGPCDAVHHVLPLSGRTLPSTLRMTPWAARARARGAPRRGALAAALDSKSIFNWTRRTWSTSIEPGPVAFDLQSVYDVSGIMTAKA